jgi:lactate dehydrogenase-like 2-hydroxyacid dehydrogenase
MVTRAAIGADRRIIDKFPNVEIIALRGVGVDRIDVAYAHSRGIVIANTPDVHSDDVAGQAMALLLASLRQIAGGHRYVTEGRWTSVPNRPALGRDLRGMTVGIFGLGRIGKLLAERLKPFKCEIAYTGRTHQKDQPYRYVPGVLELAHISDALVVCAPGGEQTDGIVNANVLAALGPEGVLVNVGRGSIVDEPALVEALTSGRLGQAALDVFTNEPAVPDALKTLENVILQPHVGAWTENAQRAIDEMLIANLDAHFAGRRLPGSVKPANM